MTAADLPERLRAMAGPIEPNVCTKAADEIERLRAELVSNTDELRTEIERLRAGGCARDQRTTQYCAEVGQWIEKCKALEAERDQLRRDVCCSALPPDYKKWKSDDVDRALKMIADQQGWDCFREVKP